MNSVWNNDNGTITFQQRRVWYFEPTMSNGTLQDQVTNLNPIAAVKSLYFLYDDFLYI